jgi:hypothetical protein
VRHEDLRTVETSDIAIAPGRPPRVDTPNVTGLMAAYTTTGRSQSSTTRCFRSGRCASLVLAVRHSRTSNTPAPPPESRQRHRVRIRKFRRQKAPAGFAARGASEAGLWPVGEPGPWAGARDPAVVSQGGALEGATKYSANPDDHALAILNEYQNADKHRELNITSLLIDDPRATVTWPTGHRDEIDYRNATPEMLLREGGTCFDSDVPVKVDLNGTVRIAMARSSDTDHRELPRSLVEIFDTVGDFLARIEDAMPSHADPSGEAPG